MECERVAGRLRIAGDPTGGDNREWRAHLEQTRVHMGNVKKGLPEVEAKLRKIADELSKGLERITQ